MGWVYLVIAGLFEMIGVVMINQWHQKRSAISSLMLLGGFGGSFLFLTMAMQSISMSTAYAVWTGIGASGGALLGMFLYGEAKSALRLFFIAMVLGSTIGLKILS